MPDYEPTEEQQAILRHDLERHARILAGPGTGKSTTSVTLIEEALKRNPPPTVRMITFTRSATRDLARKFVNHPHTATLRPSTIHSFAISVLMQNPGATALPRPIRIADEWESRNIVIKDLARKLDMGIRQVNDLRLWMAAAWESLQQEDPGPPDSDKARFTSAWVVHRRMFGYVLIDELPFALRDALINHQDLDGLAFDLYVIDEYQDLNACDLDVVRRLAMRGSTIVAVGDDDQSIYGFRKAAPSGIRDFLDEFDPADDYSLTISKRCGRLIIEWANYVIEGDLTRRDHPVPLRATDGASDGEVRLLAFDSNISEARGIARLVDRLIRREGVAESEIIVLLRGDYNGMFSKPIAEEFAALGITFANPDDVDEHLSHQGNRRLIALLRLCIDVMDSLAWATMVRLERGVGDAFYDYIAAKAAEHRATFGQTVLEEHKSGYAGLSSRVSGPARAMVQGALDWVEQHQVPDRRPDGGWTGWVLSAADGFAPKPTDGLASLIERVDDLGEATDSLDKFLGQLRPVGRDLASTQSNGVRIMTMAASKGLTATATIIAGAEDTIIPSPKGDVSEERRLLYVGMTRPTTFLYITWARRRVGPTARAGESRVRDRRAPCAFLRAGPNQSEDGDEYIGRRWPDA